MEMKILKVVGPLALFYFGWWGLILLVLNDYPLPYQILVTAIALAANFYLGNQGRRDIAWMLVGSAFGFLFDAFLVRIGLFTIHTPYFLGLAPVWIFFLWLLFTSSFEGMRYLNYHKGIAAVSGGIGGPLAYWMGQPLGLITFESPIWINVSIHVAIWATLFPALFILRDWILGTHQPQS